jgi:hypothetical protein
MEIDFVSKRTFQSVAACFAGPRLTLPLARKSEVTSAQRTAVMRAATKSRPARAATMACLREFNGTALQPCRSG